MSTMLHFVFDLIDMSNSLNESEDVGSCIFIILIIFKVNPVKMTVSGSSIIINSLSELNKQNLYELKFTLYHNYSYPFKMILVRVFSLFSSLKDIVISPIVPTQQLVSSLNLQDNNLIKYYNLIIIILLQCLHTDWLP